MFLDVRQGLFLMVYRTFKYNYAITCTVYCMSYIPFEVPCKSNTQGAENKRLKIGMLLEISEKKLISALMDKNNPNFLHILLTSVIICNCDKSVITKSHM